MKSYFLAPIVSPAEALEALSTLLPEQSTPWLLLDPTGDTIAYFSLVECDDTTGLRTIQADISGRHYHEDAAVLAVLHQLQARLGGAVTDDA